MTQPIVTTVADGVARISWGPEETVDAVRHEVAAALTGHARVEALVDPGDEAAQRVATWSGMRREGVMRGVTVAGEPVDRIVYARHADYWDKPLPYLDGMVFKVLTEENARIAALRAGQTAGNGHAAAPDMAKPRRLNRSPHRRGASAASPAPLPRSPYCRSSPRSGPPPPSPPAR